MVGANRRKGALMGDTTRTSCSIAMAKITVPPCSHLAIERVDALDALVECLTRKLVAIEAPKGSAKTSFLAEAYRRFDEDEHWEVAWLSVDGADGKQRLLCHMLAALRTIWSDLDLDGLAGLYEENENKAVVELSNFIYGHAQDKSVSYVLFVDDLHRAEPEAIEFMMALAMRYFPSNVHVVASGDHLLREYVDLAFYDEMSLFPQEKLFFSEDDIVKSLVKARDFLFSPQTPFDSLASARLEESDLKLLAGDLWDKTGGWPFGVWSYVNMLARGTIDFSVSVDKRALQSGLNRFFRNSVFDELSEDVRQFLLCVALPDRINAELCNALTGRTDAKFILRDLRVRGMFIEALPNQSEWFAFYPLFHRWLRRSRSRRALPGFGICARRRAIGSSRMARCRKPQSTSSWHPIPISWKAWPPFLVSYQTVAI